MTKQVSPYAVVIADLKKRREKIDVAIKALESLSDLPEGAIGTAMVPGAAGTPPIEGEFLGLSIPEATKKLLQMRKTPLGNAAIVKALEEGGLFLTSESKTNTVGSVLNRRARQVGDIVSPRRGQWGLKEWYPGRNFGRKAEEEEASGDVADPVELSPQEELRRRHEAMLKTVENVLGDESQ